MHPSVVRFQGRWNGYQYWMAYTPYGPGGAGQENPCIAVSQDGKEWIDPPGLTNPLVPRPAPPDSYNGLAFNANDYNSDTNLFYHDGLFYMVWRHRTTSGGGEYLWFRTTADGINWAPRQLLIDNTRRSGVGGRDLIAPSIFPMEGGGFEIWATDSALSPYGFNRYTAPALTGPWSWQSQAVFTGFPPNRSLWHSSVHKHGSKWVVLFNVTTLAGSSEGQSYFAESTDGVNFTVGDKPFAYVNQANATGGVPTYKSDFMLDEVDGKTVLRVWLASSSHFNNAVVEFNAESSLARRQRVMPAATARLDNTMWSVTRFPEPTPHPSAPRHRASRGNFSAAPSPSPTTACGAGQAPTTGR